MMVFLYRFWSTEAVSTKAHANFEEYRWANRKEEVKWCIEDACNVEETKEGVVKINVDATISKDVQEGRCYC